MGCSNNKMVNIDLTSSAVTGPIPIETMDVSFEEFFSDNKDENFETWSQHWISNDKIIFSSYSGNYKVNKHFVVFSMNDASLIASFTFKIERNPPVMAFFLEKTNSIMVLCDHGTIAIHNISSKETELKKIKTNIFTGELLSDNSILVLGKETDKTDEIPFFAELSFDGEIIRKTLLPDFTRTNCTYVRAETLFSYKKEMFWFNSADYSLYKINKDFSLEKFFTLRIPGLLTWQEKSDPKIYDKLYRSKNCTSICFLATRISDSMVLCLNSYGKYYHLVIDLNNFDYKVIDGLYPFYDSLGRNFRPVRTSHGGLASMDIHEHNLELVYPDTEKRPVIMGPSAMYIKK